MRIVNGLEDALAALRSGARALSSPPYAACHAGVGYYVALVEAAKTEFPDVDFTLCCGDDPAIAHEALRRGIPSVRCQTSPAMAENLRALAEGLDARFCQ